MSNARERGFTAVELIITLVVVAALVVVGWFVFDRMQDKDDNKTDTTQQTSDDEVKSTTDLDTANKTLDDTNLDASTSDSGELDSELSAF